MKRPTLVPLSLLAITLAGCDERGPESCDVVVHDAFRGSPGNGRSLNGQFTNGVGINAAGYQGTAINGVSQGPGAQGKSLDGIAFEGVDLGGTALGSGRDLDVTVALVGTALVGTADRGTTVWGADWIGAKIPARIDGAPAELEITAVEQQDDLEWYTLAYEGTPLCGEGVRGLFLPGVWDAAGARHDALRGAPNVAYTYSCATGVLAKCIDWGYAPETVGAELHHACTRLARADYCADGQPHTADGTLIDVIDTVGILEPDPTLDFAFEAGWGPDGAVCVSRPRYQEFDADGDELVAPCWDELPVCDTIAEALEHGAILMTRSAPQNLCYE